MTLIGTLSCPEAAEAAEQPLTIDQQERGTGAGVPTIVGTVTTAADGSFRFRSRPLRTRSVFVVRAAAARDPGRAVVPVAAAITFGGPAASGATLPISTYPAPGGFARDLFTGVVRPEQAGRTVALKLRNGQGAWRTIAFTRTGPDGRFTFAHRFEFAGQVSLAAVARPTGTERAASPVLTYAIGQAENRQLTIDLTAPAPAAPLGPSALAAPPGPLGPTPPADPAGAADPPSVASQPAAATQAATITGVALGSPHATATLLERSINGRFVSIATVETDAGGAYTFTVYPTQTSVYRITCRRQRSAALRVEVGQ